jgi:thiamine biosynthesis lipoprotein
MQLKYSLPLLLGLVFVLFSCGSDPQGSEENYLSVQGQTMGTYYKVTYEDARQRNLQEAIDSLLIALNNEVSTYIPTSVIATFNSAEDSLVLAEKGRSSDHFINNLRVAAEVYTLSDGAFDPTVMPLINFWGFGYSERQPMTKVDSSKIRKLRDLVGFDQLDLVESGERIVLKKPKPGIQLDFSALAKGYGVDIVGQLLAEKGLENYLVDIGGEVAGKGRNAKGRPWSIGVSQPSETSKLTDLVAVIPLDNKAMATSGNYRNFYEVNGVKYSHTINPQTGFPERNTLLSATIVADKCMEADALATACMVKGTTAAIKWIQQLKGVEAYLIYGKEDGSMGSWYSEGLKEVFE